MMTPVVFAAFVSKLRRLHSSTVVGVPAGELLQLLEAARR